MTQLNDKILDVAVLGGGIAGVTSAWHLCSRFPSLHVGLYESNNMWGGVLRTEASPPYYCETSADSFLATSGVPDVVELAKELGIESSLIKIIPGPQRVYILRHDKLHPIPTGLYLMVPRTPWSLLGSQLLSWRGKLRLAFEPFIPPRKSLEDESLQDFARRRVGEEAFRWIAQPLVSGIYAADPERLSISAALPQFAELERKYGSLTRGLQNSPELASERSSGVRYDKFMSCRGGIGSLIEALVRKLPAHALNLNAEVRQVVRNHDQTWSCHLSNTREIRCRALILAIPAHQAAGVMRSAVPGLASELDQIHFGSIVVVQLAFKRAAMARGFAGIGIVIPQSEGKPILAISFTSHKFEGRCPSDEVLVRVFFGGSRESDFLVADDRQLVQTAWHEVSRILGIEGHPLFSKVNRWPSSTPQYFVGHLARVDRIQTQLKDIPGLFLAGNSYRGIGIPQCIRSGREGAIAAAEYLLAKGT